MTAPPTTRTREQATFLHDVFTTALEGGIGYWSQCSDYHIWKAGDELTPDIHGFYAVIHPTEVDEDFGTPAWGVFDGDADTQALRIDINTVETGAVRLVDQVIAAVKNPDQIDFSRRYLRQFVIAWLTDGQEGDYDASVADLVVQLGLFGTVVYA